MMVNDFSEIVLVNVWKKDTKYSVNGVYNQPNNSDFIWMPFK